MGGFSSKAEAQRALEIKLGRVLPDGRPANLTLGELVEEYQETEAGYGSEAPLAAREGDRRPGEVRLAELSRRSGRSIPGRRFARSPSSSGRASVRWSCSRPRPRFTPRSCSRSNRATSIEPRVS